MKSFTSLALFAAAASAQSFSFTTVSIATPTLNFSSLFTIPTAFTLDGTTFSSGGTYVITASGFSSTIVASGNQLVATGLANGTLPTGAAVVAASATPPAPTATGGGDDAAATAGAVAAGSSAADSESAAARNAVAGLLAVAGAVAAFAI